jgi:hypothetical protein
MEQTNPGGREIHNVALLDLTGANSAAAQDGVTRISRSSCAPGAIWQFSKGLRLNASAVAAGGRTQPRRGPYLQLA